MFRVYRGYFGGLGKARNVFRHLAAGVLAKQLDEGLRVRVGSSRGFRVQGLGRLGFRVQGLGFRVG